MAAVMLATALLERTTGTYRFRIVDDTGHGIPLASLTTVTLTYADVATGAVINSRSAQNALNANGVTVVSIGDPPVTTVTWTLTSNDTVMVGVAARETHSILFQWTWAAGVRRGAHEAHFTVENLVGVA